MRNIVLFAALTTAFSAYSEETKIDTTKHYVSVGKSTITSEFDGYSNDIDGFGFTWNVIEGGSNWGWGINMEFASTDEASSSYAQVDETMWNFSLAIPYRPTSANWLSVYPIIGMSYYMIEASGWVNGSETETGFNVGFGANATIPKTDIFVDLNFKVHNMGGILDESDITSTYLGLGYRF